MTSHPEDFIDNYELTLQMNKMEGYLDNQRTRYGNKEKKRDKRSHFGAVFISLNRDFKKGVSVIGKS